MRILVVNPNTSDRMTHHLARELERIRDKETELVFVNPPHGPESIESAYEEAYAIPEMLPLIKSAQAEGYDAVILACFADPGLDAARELVSIPVIGIEESALHVAAMLGDTFSILTSRPERVAAKKRHVAKLGLERRLASVRPLEMSVLEMEEDPQRAQIRIQQVSEQAVRKDGAEVIVLGCAGLAGYTSEIESSLAVPVVDPTPVALKFAEVLVQLGLTHSRRGLYAPPPPKRFK